MNNYTHFSRLRNFVKKTLLSSRKPGASAAGCRVKILQNRRPPAANYKVFAEIHLPRILRLPRQIKKKRGVRRREDQR